MKIIKQKLYSKNPSRRCISSGKIFNKSDMVRFIVDPNNEILPDISEKLPGRGIWVKTEKNALDQAISKNLFLKAANKKVLVRKNLSSLVEDILLKTVLSLISLSRKSGAAINGYEKVKSSLVDGTAKVLIQAKDGSVNQKRKLRPPSGKENYINCLTSKELGEAFGRNYVVHVSLTSGGLSKRVVHEASRLNKLRGFEPLETIILEGTNNN